ncbi:hypothetical protein ACI2LC_46205 [Nonomuraea wenchangensis]|uniref:hypothetical protein n=1 Tax=Nonomuraea wenchangensis TaxID=568860 RepID=UPI0038504FEA
MGLEGRRSPAEDQGPVNEGALPWGIGLPQSRLSFREAEENTDIDHIVLGSDGSDFSMQALDEAELREYP